MEGSVVIICPATMEEYYNSDDQKKKNDHDGPELFTDSDMAAAQQLMQLSDEENHSNKENITDDDHEEVDQISLKIIRSRRAWSKIEEIFGKEEEEEEGHQEVSGDDRDRYRRPHHDQRPRKKRKFRSLASIYSETKPNIDEKKMSNFVMTKKKKSSR